MSQATSPSVFEFHANAVRAIVIDGEPWFVTQDVMRALGYASDYKPAVALRGTPEEWKGVYPIHTPGGEQKMLCLSEPGLYFFLGRSDKPAALQFQKWVYGEVLPSIRKTGGYGRRDHQFMQDAIRASARIAAEAQQEIFTALMNNEDWRSDRWLMNFIPDRDGKLTANIRKIDGAAWVLTLAELAKGVRNGDVSTLATDEELLAVSEACIHRLQGRDQIRRAMEQAKKPQTGALAVA